MNYLTIYQILIKGQMNPAISSTGLHQGDSTGPVRSKPKCPPALQLRQKYEHINVQITVTDCKSRSTEPYQTGGRADHSQGKCARPRNTSPKSKTEISTGAVIVYNTVTHRPRLRARPHPRQPAGAKAKNHVPRTNQSNRRYRGFCSSRGPA